MPWMLLALMSSGNAAAARRCLRPLQPVLKQVLDSMLGALQRVPHADQVGSRNGSAHKGKARNIQLKPWLRFCIPTMHVRQ
jgi:hypothetical protein